MEISLMKILAVRLKKKLKATLFIHGLYLKLQACGAVYMKQIQILLALLQPCLMGPWNPVQA